MISPPRQSDSPQSNKMMTMAIMVALGVILHRLEALLPLPSPWIKLGLANLMTLVALIFLGFKEAVIVTFLRVVLGSILGGTFLGPTFFLSLVGGIAAILVMGMLYKVGKNRMSLIGISILGAYTHTLATSLCLIFSYLREFFFYIASLFCFHWLS